MRMKFHKEFWDIAEWLKQNSFIKGCTKLEAPKRPKKTSFKRKNISTTIYIQELRVCKPFFLKTLDISNRRFITAVLKKMPFMNMTLVKDGRGRAPPGTKIPEDARQKIKDHINSFPTFKSHYSRKDAPFRRYLSPDLNTAKMYSLYKQKCELNGDKPVKEHFFRQIFNNNCNLSFYKLRSDTCNLCDKLENLIKTENNGSEKRKLEIEKELHLRRAEAAREAKKTDIKKCEGN